MSEINNQTCNEPPVIAKKFTKSTEDLQTLKVTTSSFAKDVDDRLSRVSKGLEILARRQKSSEVNQEAVRRLRGMLNKALPECDKLDETNGRYDKALEQRVAQFQAKHFGPDNKSEIDGIVGKKTLAALVEASKATATDSGEQAEKPTSTRQLEKPVQTAATPQQDSGVEQVTSASPATSEVAQGTEVTSPKNQALAKLPPRNTPEIRNDVDNQKCTEPPAIAKKFTKSAEDLKNLKVTVSSFAQDVDDRLSRVTKGLEILARGQQPTEVNQEAVRRLKGLLNKALPECDKLDETSGTYNKALEQRVAQFQAKHFGPDNKSEIDGIVGKKTLAALAQASKTTATEAGPQPVQVTSTQLEPRALAEPIPQPVSKMAQLVTPQLGKVTLE